ncbi:MAG: DNA-binding protein WhiA [Lachnospiraceae bacterium]|nr:DNA-binding protein WhiA [Lachnospiraceae bacterium]
MSFSNKVKEELFKTLPQARHCRIAELAALIGMSGAKRRPDVLAFENRMAGMKAQLLIKKLFGYDLEEEKEPVQGDKQSRRGLYTLSCTREQILTVFEALKMKNNDSSVFSVDKQGQNIHNTLRNDTVPGMLVCTQTCCKSAFLRGAFLTCGSLSDPEKDYHLEFVLKNKAQADMLREILSALSVEAGSVIRKKAHVLYLKDSEIIATTLTLVGAHVALMELENVKIYKEVRNNINRYVNCETANIEKTVRAASKQVEDISFLASQPGFDDLPEELRTTAALRLSHPDVSLSELAELHPAAVSKSGINHRLRKLCDMAERIRKSRNDRG